MNALPIGPPQPLRPRTASHRVIRGAFGLELGMQLLDHALCNESRFEKSGLRPGGDVDENVRVSRKLTDLGALASKVERQISTWLPSLVAELGLTPFNRTGFEIELVAHGDGAFYRRHIDLRTGSERPEASQDRLLSVVYFFFREPRAFAGGALRLYPGAGLAQVAAEEKIDVSVEQDMAVAFSSWMPHEVLPVSCASGAFRDSRFAVNCWVLRERKSPN